MIAHTATTRPYRRVDATQECYMIRDLSRLTGTEHDLLVIGGGIYGLFIAWDAAMRGLSVALVEKGDLGGATTANTFRVVHGGLRYLQHADIGRMRQSISERATLMRIAPHLVRPLPFLIPAYGHGMKGPVPLALALLSSALVGAGKKGPLPLGRLVSRSECLRLFPALDARGLTGGIIYHDGQLQSSERLAIAVARAAAETGAALANYVEATGFLASGRRVIGATARDVLSGARLEVRARVTVNAVGPWMDAVLGLPGGFPHRRGLLLSRALNLLIRRPLVQECAVGFYSRGTGLGLSSRARMYFIAPWHGMSLVGTRHLPHDGGPDGLAATEADVMAFLEEINSACPALRLGLEDMVRAYVGLLPADHFTAGGVQLTRHYRVHDHAEDGMDGLVSVMGVKLTESRHVAERAVDLVARKLRRRLPPCATATTPVYGGDASGQDSRPWHGLLAPDIQRHLAQHYGSAWHEVARLALERPGLARRPWSASPVVAAEVVHAVRREMALKLGDVVFRRTSLGLAGVPDEACLWACAALMGNELGWDAARARREIAEVMATGRPVAVGPVAYSGGGT